ncbi:MAG TPA: amidohydrolase family protein [Candidatus Polarisedimenticolia bacterium]|nr:amidohydrolase family protein [Candidatus Polarisedimenticolia bacterium]
MRRLLIRGGTLVDGTGSPARRADVIVEGDRVAGVVCGGSGPADPDALVEADGLHVCPGFIDVHSHGDLIHAMPFDVQRRLLSGRVTQGITTEIVGNCGLGVFPCAAATTRGLRAVASWMTPPEAVEGAPHGDWAGGLWSDLAGYLAHLESGDLLMNVGALQPHGPLRMETAGLQRREPDATLKRSMARRLEEALDAGAFGLSTGLIYPPGIFTTTDEIVDLARLVARRTGGAGLVASHIRGSSETLLDAVEELIEVGRRSGARVQHSHNEAVGPRHWPLIGKVLEMEEAARRSGVAVAYDMFPYTAAATMMIAIYPPWSLEGGVDRLLERLATPLERRAIGEAIESVSPRWPPWTVDGWPHNLVRAVGWDRITIGSVASRANRDVEGMSLQELGHARGLAPFDAISDLMIEEGGRVSQIIHGISGDEDHEEGIAMLLADGAGAVCTDASDFGKGKPHPAAYGTYPRVLGRFVRERHVLTLEEAIRKMTGYPAELTRLKDRGVVRAGAFADLVVFDAASIGSDATYDRPRTPASGIRNVLVNGVDVLPASDGGGVQRPGGRVVRPGR